MNELEILKRRVEELENLVSTLHENFESLKSISSLPKEIGDTIAERISDSDQSITTANIQTSIDTSGPTALVLAYPDGFRRLRVGGKDYYIPYYLNS